ncbi:hypothetical protein [Aquabacterium sp.]|uniref:DUF6708 domain-containing protein n=1 Tax=Aquabacterium sp. TaxID=1872578 RepID=UPI0024877900|nr:hypothetical protein [Aquabacterium sp.]MDI1258279.1 hypothetical protein [Aquabacterium sp.]
MEYSGLTTKYPVNRPLTELDRARQLRQHERLDVALVYQLNVIKVDEQTLELVDKYYALKGAMTFAMAAIGFLFALFLADVTIFSATTPGRMAEDWPVLLAFYAMVAPLFAVLYWGFRREGYAFTHYPICFDRIALMVHVFRLNGTVLSVPWDEVFFCLDKGHMNFWNVRGHVLASDKVTVLETFSLSVTAGDAAKEVALGFWEMVRGYMEDGPEPAMNLAQILLPIADQRESFSFGFHRMHAVASGESVLAVLLFGVISACFAPFRWLAMRTSKIPQWPADVRASFGKLGKPSAKASHKTKSESRPRQAEA